MLQDFQEGIKVMPPTLNLWLSHWFHSITCCWWWFLTYVSSASLRWLSLWFRAAQWDHICKVFGWACSTCYLDFDHWPESLTHPCHHSLYGAVWPTPSQETSTETQDLDLLWQPSLLPSPNTLPFLWPSGHSGRCSGILISTSKWKGAGSKSKLRSGQKGNSVTSPGRWSHFHHSINSPPCVMITEQAPESKDLISSTAVSPQCM